LRLCEASDQQTIANFGWLIGRKDRLDFLGADCVNLSTAQSFISAAKALLN
jgi:hypothetical protein